MLSPRKGASLFVFMLLDSILEQMIILDRDPGARVLLQPTTLTMTRVFSGTSLQLLHSTFNPSIIFMCSLFMQRVLETGERVIMFHIVASEMQGCFGRHNKQAGQVTSYYLVSL